MKKATSPGFYTRCREMLGDDFDAFLEAQSRPLQKIIRVNTLKNSLSEFLSFVAEHHPDWTLTPHIFGAGIFSITRKNTNTPLGHSLAHIQGRFYLQEASSCLPSLALNISPDNIILDIAAAPGSKTTQIAALLRATGLVVANEFSASRAKILVYNLQKNGVTNAVVSNTNGVRFGKVLPNFFDRILIDAPCTGEGTARKDGKALDNWSERNIFEMAKLQKKLLESAFLALRENGILVYSTCTFAPEENEAVVTDLCKKYGSEMDIIDLSTLFSGAKNAPGLSSFRGENFPEAEKMLRIWPHTFYSEGFFVAALRKKNRTDISFLHFSRHGKRYNASTTFLRWKERTGDRVLRFFQNEFSFALPRESILLQKKNDIFLAPKKSGEVSKALQVDRNGLKICRLYPNDIRPSHDVALSWGRFFSGSRVFEVNEKEARVFLRGEDFPKNALLPRGDILIRYLGLPLGFVKNTGEKLKNNLPRNFVRGGGK